MPEIGPEIKTQVLTIISTYVEFLYGIANQAFEANSRDSPCPASSVGALVPRLCHQQKHWDCIGNALPNFSAVGEA
jgi:hypothetical protein